MLPWIKLDTATVPDDGAELRLMQRGGEFSIMAGATELMNSRLSGSEEALARLSFAKIRETSHPRVLIGGLGMGFTLRAALGLFGEDARIMVAELVPAVVRWARGPLAGMFGGCLDDPRVHVREADVAALIAAPDRQLDAIMLDVDNGPEGLSRPANDGLYSRSGLGAAHRALRPGGVLSVWSSEANPAFTKRLAGCGFLVEEVRVRARGKRGARHTIWIAVKGG